MYPVSSRLWVPFLCWDRLLLTWVNARRDVICSRAITGRQALERRTEILMFMVEQPIDSNLL